MSFFLDPEHIENTVLHALTDFRNIRALEIGVGDGRMARHYLSETSGTIGVDVDYEELMLARQDYVKAAPAKVSLAQAQAEALPFAGASFDMVVFAWSL